MNYTSINLNNQIVSSEEIARICMQESYLDSLPEWEKYLYLFLNEWFDDSEFISVRTSGSTGEPKLIELSKSFMLTSAKRTIGYFGLKKDDRILLSLSCRYIAGKMMVVRAIAGQMNLMAVDPADSFDFLQNDSFDFGAMVPNQVFKILEQDSGKEKLQNIRNLLVGGSAISAELERQISQFTNRIVSTYGMTETSSNIAIRELSGSRISEYYHCLEGIRVELGVNDCLRIQVSDMDKPIQTNDLAVLQSEKSFRILGRSDSMIISGGIKYSPETIEKKLEGLINQRFVISSIPDEKLGEKLVLVIEGQSYSTESIFISMFKILNPFEQPKMIFFLDHFPENGLGKVMRSTVKDAIL